MLKILAILSLTALNASLTYAGPSKVSFVCNIKNGPLRSFVLSFERPESNSFSTPIKISSPAGENSGTVSCSRVEAQTALADHYMLEINTDGNLGFLNLDLIVTPDFNNVIGPGFNSEIETLIISCKNREDNVK